MAVKELIEYLQGFPEESDVHYIIVNPTKRMSYTANVGVITDMDHPVLVYEITDEEPFDEELIQVAEECEQ